MITCPAANSLTRARLFSAYWVDRIILLHHDMGPRCAFGGRMACWHYIYYFTFFELQI